MDASCKIQRSIHDVRLTYKYVSRILGTYQICPLYFYCLSRYRFHKSSSSEISYILQSFAHLPPTENQYTDSYNVNFQKSGFQKMAIRECTEKSIEFLLLHIHKILLRLPGPYMQMPRGQLQ